MRMIIQISTDVSFADDPNKGVRVSSLRVNPSVETENGYFTNKPIYFAMALACVFIFTGSIFFLYDCYIRRRQNIVGTAAARTGAIVNALFPEAVRDRMFENVDDKLGHERKDAGGDPWQDGGSRYFRQEADAAIYQECTILFAFLPTLPGIRIGAAFVTLVKSLSYWRPCTIRLTRSRQGRRYSR